VKGQVLADELGISLRTLYRDIGVLRAQGVPVDGEAGVGFLLRPGFTLPPLMFTAEELEALILGARWVVDRADGDLGKSAKNALVKIGAVLPSDRKVDLGANTFLIPSQPRPRVDDGLFRDIRASIRNSLKLDITYRDLKEQLTSRTIWPFALAFYDQVLVVAAWCETRRDFRHFRLDRVEQRSISGTKFLRSRTELLREWREKFSIPADWTADTF